MPTLHRKGKPTISQYVYLWEFWVRPGCERQFLDAYGPGGYWVALFQQSSGYLDTRLYRDLGNPTRFVTIDYWRSRDDWESFRRQFAEEFQQLDQACQPLMLSETRLGDFQQVDFE